jgi:hypothetical protein
MYVHMTYRKTKVTNQIAASLILQEEASSSSTVCHILQVSIFIYKSGMIRPSSPLINHFFY